MRAFNGNWNGGWVQANITDPGVAPAMVTANNLTVAYNQSVPLTNIFAVTGSDITQYQLWFSWPEGGAPTLGTVTNNGAPIPLDQAVTTSNLSGLVYTGSANQGTDALWLKTFNGSWTSNWVRANIVDSGSSAQTPTGTGASASADNSAMPRSIGIGAGDTLELSSAYSGAVTFLADTGALKVDNASSFTGTVAGLAGQDSIELCDVAFAAGTTPSYSATDDNSGTLMVSDRTHTANLALLGNYVAASFVTASDGHGGTMITISSPSEQQHMAASHSNWAG
jgi:hypothetical protein